MIFIYVMVAFIIGGLGQLTSRSFLIPFLVSLFFTPIFGILFVVCFAFDDWYARHYPKDYKRIKKTPMIFD